MKNSIKTAAKTMAAVIAAGAMAVAPVAGTINFGALTAMAAIANEPTNVPTGTVTINGLTSSDTVKLYQIVQPTYNTSGEWSGYEPSATGIGVSIDSTGTNLDITVNILMSKLSSLTAVTTTGTVSDTTYTASDIKPGVYLAVISSTTGAVIYNPVFVSVSYDKNSEGALVATGKAVNVSSNFTAEDGKISNKIGTVTNVAYAKSSSPDLTKVITNGDTDGVTASSETAFKAEDLQIGDTSDFKITSTIPDYRAYTNLNEISYILDDNQDVAFGHPTISSVQVTNNGTSSPEIVDAQYYSVTYGSFTTDGNSYEKAAEFTANSTADTDEDFEITFTKDFVVAHPAATVTVRYSAVLKDDTKLKVYSSGNDNNVQLSYTYNNDGEPKIGKKHDSTTDYTFKIDVQKVDSENTSTNLAGAKFTITRMWLVDGALTSTNPTQSDTDHTGAGNCTSDATTDSTGTVTFKGLDEGYYMIEESQKPTGYSLNAEKFYIKVTATYANQATSTAPTYSIKTVGADGNDAAPSSATFSGDATDGYKLQVKDVKLSGLPATGARSALILTIAGIAVMVTVMAAARKRQIED